MKIQQALDAYVQQLRADGRSEHTVGQAKRHVLLLARVLGDRDISTIKHEDIAAFLTCDLARRTHDGRPKQAGSSNALRSSIRCFFAFTTAAAITPANPAALVRRARIGPRPPRSLSAAEWELVLAALDANTSRAGRRDSIFFRLLMSTGLRLASALAITVDDVDLDEATIRVRTVKNLGRYDVYLQPAMVAELREYLRDYQGGLLFPIGSRHARNRLQAAARRAGVKRSISPHTLRHCFAMRLYEREGDIELVRAALGHASIASTAIYARATGSMVREAVLRAVPAGP